MAKRSGESFFSRLYYRRRYQINAGLLGLLAAAIVGVVVYLVTGWCPYIAYLVGINVATLAMFGVDKGLSKTDQVRIPEVVFHLFTLLGGLVGQLLGRYLFHHKTNFQLHPAFTFILIPGILIQGVVFYLLYSLGGCITLA